MFSGFSNLFDDLLNNLLSVLTVFLNGLFAQLAAFFSGLTIALQ